MRIDRAMRAAVVAAALVVPEGVRAADLAVEHCEYRVARKCAEMQKDATFMEKVAIGFFFAVEFAGCSILPE